MFSHESRRVIGFDRHGNLPSGELSAVGDASGPKDVGGEDGGGEKIQGQNPVVLTHQFSGRRREKAIMIGRDQFPFG